MDLPDWRNLALSSLLIFAFLLTVTGCSGDQGGQQKESVQIAANLPLSGNLATYGNAVQEGANMAVSDLDSLHKDGPDLNFDWKDNTGETQRAVSIAQSQLRSSPDVYVSGVKPQVMAIEERISNEGLPHFVYIFDININKSGNNNFRTWVSYKIEPPAYVKYAKSRKSDRLAMVYVRLPHSVEAYEGELAPALRKHGGVDSLMIESYDSGKRDFKDIAAKLDDFNPDTIILNGFQSNLVGLVRALRPLDLIQDGNTIATYDMLDAANVLSADELEGIRVVAPEFIVSPDDRFRRWRQRFRNRYGDPPIYTNAYGYDMALAIHSAATRVDRPVSNKDWIEALSATDTTGVTGPIKFNEEGDLLTPLKIGVYRDGKLNPEMEVPLPQNSPISFE